MKIKSFAEKVKTINYSPVNLTLSILKLESSLKTQADPSKIIDSFGIVLLNIISFSNKHNIELNSTVSADLDMDSWKDNIQMYHLKVKGQEEEYLYAMRTALKNLLDETLDKKKNIIEIRELLSRTFLLIDSHNFNIDSILDKVVKKISVKSENQEKKKE